MVVLAENAYGSPEIHNMLLYKTDSIGAFNSSNDSAFISVGKELSQTEQYLLFPNPSEGKVSISSNHKQKTDYFLYNEMGSVILNGKFSHHENLDLSRLPSGIYCIKLESQNKIETQKLIIKH
jgi:hypothetical protein